MSLEQYSCTNNTFSIGMCSDTLAAPLHLVVDGYRVCVTLVIHPLLWGVATPWDGRPALVRSSVLNFSCQLYFFPYSLISSSLFLFPCLISFLLFQCASVWENTRLRVVLVFFARRISPCFAWRFTYQKLSKLKQSPYWTILAFSLLRYTIHLSKTNY